ncbi:hypothetical protein [Curtobacterium sp. MCJR17_043]|uniref:hypothetical protein n=1 Tax=Curtobacterium sp. MCJR17_043 TaxID=2175660 RepID=UPI0024E02C56|nr:hypothetical protein [Curtobacterium sp. MCJR17_043]WIB35016.1 hypothetical protein DEJ15_11095 [Curtobacterium sp. MCJR17_043]
MIAVIVACEVGFWIAVLGGLTLRSVAGMPRLGAAVLVLAPVLDAVLLVVTAIDLRAGGIGHVGARTRRALHRLLGHLRAPHDALGGPAPRTPPDRAGTPPRSHSAGRTRGSAGPTSCAR